MKLIVRTGAALAAAALGLAACSMSMPQDSASSPTQGSTSATTGTTESSGNGDAKDAAASGPSMIPGQYIPYSDYVNNPEDFADSHVVLYFSAAWCSTCQGLNNSLQADGVPDGLTVVKVDYDSSQNLKQQYGVTLQHTLVQVDPSGEALTKFTGSLTGQVIKDNLV